jgi:GH15 family glucan-1,4-alpha-glucosidase
MTEQKMAEQNLDLAVIGNGRTAALLNPLSQIVWWCFPRFDGDPVFCRLLAGDEEKGFTDVLLDGQVSTHSAYVRNTAVLSTVLTDKNGASVRITDFAPRFYQFGRTFRPPQLMRIIEPIAGLPRVTIRFRPTSGYGQGHMQRAFGSNHIRYTGGDAAIRLTTDAPLAYIDRESPFVLSRPVSLVFGADTPFEGELATTCREFADRTRDYWEEWIRRLAISYEWQDAVIRAAITLKLSAFEETGAIIAAHTTSIPEAPGSGRTWDYRFCWLRDAYFVVRSLNRIGASRTMEDYINYILTIVTGSTGELQPVYSIVSTDPLEERIVADLKGYRGDGPVRIGNAAVAQNQHDTYGSAILAATPMFFDRRLPRMGDENLFRMLEPLGEKSAELALVPDAGIWEFRERRSVHTHSVAMCWAGCHRLEVIAAHLGLNDRAAYWGKHSDHILKTMLDKSWNEKRGAFTAAFGREELDASVLLLNELGAVEADDPRFVSTVNAMERELKFEMNVMRYTNADDFGLPETAFLICRFWLIDALWAIGRKQDARDMFVDALKLRNSYGLLSEDVHPATGQLWGNFPQTYSMAGLILSAIRLSKSWEDRYWRGS